jgi:two-component system response regulator FixJ
MSPEQGNPAPVIHLLDDDPDYLDSLVQLLASFRFEPRPYSSGQYFLARVSDLEPGPLLLDLKMPALSGYDVLAALEKRQPHRPAIVLTGSADVPGVVRCYASGLISAFLQKHILTDLALLEAIQHAVAEDTQRRAAYSGRLHFQSLLQRLTPTDLKVFQRLLQGQTNVAIAAALQVSRRSVECRRAKLMSTFGVTNLCELALLAFKSGFTRLS